MAAERVAVEAVADVAEAVSEESAQVAEVARRLTERETGLVFGGLGIGVAVGVIGGYLIFRKSFKTKFEKIADEEIQKMRTHYSRKLFALETKEEKLKTASEIAKNNGYTPPAPDPREGGGPIAYHKIGQDSETEDPPESETKNIFENKEEIEADAPVVEWDYTAEIESRTKEAPYVIHKDEFEESMAYSEENGEVSANVLDYERHTLTYYEGDDILSDARDQVMDDKEGTVGTANLSKFGHGSGDPNTVYIRNDNLKVDIEVVRSTGKYATEVHGFQEDELQHSSTMSRRRPRRSELDDMER